MEVVDTNVLLIANKQHGDISLECQLICIQLLEAIKRNGSVAIDADYLIVSEYRNKTKPNKGKGAGDDRIGIETGIAREPIKVQLLERDQRLDTKLIPDRQHPRQLLGVLYEQ